MISLRRIERSDLKLLFRMRNDKDVWQWCRQFAPLHWERHDAWYEWQAKDPHTEMFIIDRGTVPVGACGLTSIDYVNRRAEFSLYIGKDHQGKGLGKDALIELFKFGFSSLGLNRIYGETFAENPAIKLFEGLGMEKEGDRRDYYFRDGRFIDAHLYSISATDFNTVLGINEYKEPKHEHGNVYVNQRSYEQLEKLSKWKLPQP